MQRLEPLDPPYDPDVARTLTRMMPPGQEPLKLFRTVAHNRHILDKLRSTGAYLLNFGTLDPADRELVIQRTCARCGCEYEWGVHADGVRRPGRPHRRQARGDRDRGARGRGCDLERARGFAGQRSPTSFTTRARFPTRLGTALAEHYDEAQLVELVALAGQYHAVSFLANALGVEREDAAERFPTASAA